MGFLIVYPHSHPGRMGEPDQLAHFFAQMPGPSAGTVARGSGARRRAEPDARRKKVFDISIGIVFTEDALTEEI